MTTFSQAIRNFDLRRTAAYETTPAILTAEIARFASPNGDTDLEIVPVRPRPGAREGCCATNVLEAVKAEGGYPIYGCTAWVGSYFMTAEPHTVWMTTTGKITDPTPKTDGEHVIAFARDSKAGRDYNFLTRPPARRMRTYKGRTQTERAGDFIACMSAPQMKAMKARAEKVGVTLQQFIISRTPERDALEMAIDTLLECSDRVEALLTPTTEGLFCKDVGLYDQLTQQKYRLLKRLDGIVDTRKRLLGAARAGVDVA